MHSARIRPVEPAPATTAAVLAMHTGHIVPSFDGFHRPACQSARATRNQEHVCTQAELFAVYRGPACFRAVHVGAHCCLVPFRPPAHTPERPDDCPSEFAQRILDGKGLRSHHAPRNQTGGFEIAKSSGEHTLRDVSQVVAQFPVPVRLLLKKKQNAGRPSADEN
jgi:hypothetical protein